MTSSHAKDAVRLQPTPELLQSLLVLELLRPSRTFCIVNAALGNEPVIDNRARQFGLLCPDWPAERIRWTGVIENLLQRGVEVTLILDESVPSTVLRRDLTSLKRRFPASLVLNSRRHIVTCGMAGDFFAVRGSLHLQDQSSDWCYTTDPNEAREWRSLLEEGEVSS